MIRSTISDTKNRLSELLVRVQSGETLIILDRKTPVARVERIRTLTGNPHLLPPRKKWNAATILELPIEPLSSKASSLTDAVREERESGW
jgi:hypothetical protein